MYNTLAALRYQRLLSLLILLSVDHMLNDSFCCFYNANDVYEDSFIGKQYIHLLKLLIKLSEIGMILHELLWIRLKQD